MKEPRPGAAVSRRHPARFAIGMCIVWAGSGLAAERTNQPVTFAKDIAPILQEKCQNCHRAGPMAPMSLVTYEETRPWAKSIKQRVVTRQHAAVASRQDRRHSAISERHVAERRPDRDHRALGGCGRAAGRSEGHAGAQSMAEGRRLAARRNSSGSRISSSSPIPTPCRPRVRTSGSSRSRRSRSPSRAGCAPSRCGRPLPPAARSRITRWPICSRKSPEPTPESPPRDC